MGYPSRRRPPLPRRRILVVYDEGLTRAFPAQTLSNGHDVIETPDLGIALGLLAASRPYFDVVVLTCMNPRPHPRYRQAIGFAHTAFQRWPWMPMVVISRCQERAPLTGDALLTGVRLILAKPVSKATLVGTIKRVAPRLGLRLPAAPGVIVTMRRILAFLGRHFGENTTLGELAAMAAMSRSHFSHTFHAVFGQPLRDYVRDLRLDQAHRLILGSGRSLTDIAIETGFYDLPHFDKVFRRRIGLSPREYRSRYRGGAGRPVRILEA